LEVDEEHIELGDIDGDVRAAESGAEEASRSAATIDLGDWSLEEYRTLRQESLQAQAAQHLAIQWAIATTIAAIAAVFLLEQIGDSGVNSSSGRRLQYVLLGFALPGFMFLSCMSWLGEVRRMMRAGAYLRAIECSVEVQAKAMLDTSSAWPPVPSWERYLAGRDVPGLRPAGRDWEGYLGSLGVYVGAEFASLLAFLILWWDDFNPIEDHALWRLSPALAIAWFVVLFGATFLVVYFKILPLGWTKENPEATPKRLLKRVVTRVRRRGADVPTGDT
jgi:hypothetical protein